VVESLISDIKKGAQTMDVWEQGVEENIYMKKHKMTGGWRKLHNEELRGLYSSPSIIRITKSRRIRSAGHVARMGEKKIANSLLVGKPGERDHYEQKDIGG
jgi:hypothetical protein